MKDDRLYLVHIVECINRDLPVLKTAIQGILDSLGDDKGGELKS